MLDSEQDILPNGVSPSVRLARSDICWYRFRPEPENWKDTA